MGNKILIVYRILLFSFVIFLVYKFISLPAVYLLNNNKLSIIDDSPSKDIVVIFINLNKSQDRLNALVPLLKKLNLPYIRVEGVEATNLTKQNLKNVDQEIFQYFSLRGKGIRKGEIACFLSHEKAWQTFLSTNYKYALILEDDATFNPSELSKAINILLKHHNLWDVVKFTSFQTFLVKKFKILELFNPFNLYYIGGYNDILASYFINRQAATNLIAKAQPIKMPVDMYIIRGWELNLKLAIIDPNLIQQNGISSTISNTEVFGKDPTQHTTMEKLNKLITLLKIDFASLIYNFWIYKKV